MVRDWFGPALIIGVCVNGSVGPAEKFWVESEAFPNCSVRIFWMVSQVAVPRKVSGWGLRIAWFCVRVVVLLSATQYVRRFLIPMEGWEKEIS